MFFLKLDSFQGTGSVNLIKKHHDTPNKLPWCFSILLQKSQYLLN